MHMCYYKVLFPFFEYTWLRVCAYEMCIGPHAGRVSLSSGQLGDSYKIGLANSTKHTVQPVLVAFAFSLLPYFRTSAVTVLLSRTGD